jgi:hypothetical protein
MLQLLLRKLVRAGENWLAFIFGTGWKINLEPAGFCIWIRLVFVLFPWIFFLNIFLTKP